jgi:RHS repeat-associated protein
VRKRVMRASDAGPLRVDSVTRYAWDSRQLVHLQTKKLTETGELVREELRTFAYEDAGSYSPFAEKLQIDGGDGEWLFLSTDFMGTPEELLRADGSIAGVLDRTAWGRSTAEGETTLARFPGQFADPDLGLIYNHFRYYDDEIGRYISPDPISIAGGLNLYAYCTNPVDEFDALGLHGMQFGVFGPSDPQNPNGAPVGPNTSTQGVGAPNENGSWGTLQSGANGQPNNDPKWANQGTGHTEQKALHLLDTNKDARDALKEGGTAKMAGDYPPCPKCHRKMEKWAKKNLKGTKGSLEYHYPVKEKMTYTGAGAVGNTTGAQSLKTQYDKGMQVNPKGPVTPDGPKTFASQEYQAQKAAAEKANANFQQQSDAGESPAPLTAWPP